MQFLMNNGTLYLITVLMKLKVITMWRIRIHDFETKKCTVQNIFPVIVNFIKEKALNKNTPRFKLRNTIVNIMNATTALSTAQICYFKIDV